MIRLDRSPGAVTIVSRLARPRALAVVAGVLLAGAAAAARPAPPLAWALGAAALLVVALGARSVRARFERGRVRVRHGVPFRRDARALAEFSGACVETVAEARRRRAEARARAWRERSGGAELPSWMRAPDVPGANDRLRRILLLARGGEHLPVTAWLAEDDLEAARAEVEGLLR
jgi:hypothetical protein